MVNRAFVQRFLNEDHDAALGRTVAIAVSAEEPDARRQIVGVVEDSAYESLREATPPVVYIPVGQGGVVFPTAPVNTQIGRVPGSLRELLTLAVRVDAGDPAALAAPVVSAIERVDSGIKLDIRTLSAQVEGTLTEERLAAAVAGLIAGLALLLGVLGIYGVTLLTVRRQREKIAICMALGATAGGIVRVTMGRLGGMVVAAVTAVLTAAGVTAGLVAVVPVLRMQPSEMLRQR